MQNVGSGARDNNLHSLYPAPKSPVNVNGINDANGEHKYSINEWQEVVRRRRPPTADTASTTSTQRNGRASGAMANGVADFFGPEIFQIVLHNPTTSYQLLLFSQSRFCGENMEFLEKVREA